HRAVNFVVQQISKPAQIERRRSEVADRHSKFLEILPWQIHPAASEILPYIAKNVGQLKRDSARFGVLESLRILKAENVNANKSDNRSDVITVSIERLKRVVRSDPKVHFRSFNQVVEIIDGNPKRLNRVAQCRQQQMRIRTIRQGSLQLRTPILEFDLLFFERAGS